LKNLASNLSIVSCPYFGFITLVDLGPMNEAVEIISMESIDVLKTLAKRLKVSIRGKLTVKKCRFILARLGGFVGRKADVEPGIQSIWRGSRKLMECL
jgi:hypothetical protein